MDADEAETHGRRTERREVEARGRLMERRELYLLIAAIVIMGIIGLKLF